MVRALLLLLVVVLGTLAACSPSVEETGTSSDGLTDGSRLTDAQVQTLLTRAAFPGGAIPRMVCIAKYESGFNDLFVRGKSNGTWDLGLFAINTVHVANTPGCPTKVDGLYDAAANTKCALAVFGMYGFRGWPAYAANKAECDNYRVGR